MKGYEEAVLFPCRAPLPVSVPRLIASPLRSCLCLLLLREMHYSGVSVGVYLPFSPFPSPATAFMCLRAHHCELLTAA